MTRAFVSPVSLQPQTSSFTPASKPPVAPNSAPRTSEVATPQSEQPSVATLWQQTQRAAQLGHHLGSYSLLPDPQSILSGQGRRPDSSPPIRPNRTGLPDCLKSGIESLSGVSLDNVRVHYNSARPAQVKALAYAQGADIHVAPGQEQHLPHEAWHVVQQAQGRVPPTLQAKGMAINDDPGLESEAEVMGEKALQTPIATPSTMRGSHRQYSSLVTIAPLRSSLNKPSESQDAVVQGYFEQKYHRKGSWLQADDLSLVVKTGYPNHKLYAKKGKAAWTFPRFVGAGVVVMRLRRTEPGTGSPELSVDEDGCRRLRCIQRGCDEPRCVIDTSRGEPVLSSAWRRMIPSER